MQIQTTNPVKKEEPLADEALRMLQDAFSSRGIDIKPFCSSAQGHVKHIFAVKPGGKLLEGRSISFADGDLYVSWTAQEAGRKEPASFVIAAIDAVEDGLKKQAKRKKSYSTLEQDLAYLHGLRSKFQAPALNKSVTPKKAEGEELVELEGKVFVPKSLHRLYQSLSYAKKGIYLNEQAFAPAYAAYQRGVQAGDIKPGLFLIADYNLHRSHRRFYVMDFSDPQHPKVLDAFKVAHGSGSDRDGWVDALSNEPESHKSSRGLYAFKSSEWRTDRDFRGYVWRLQGVDSSDFLALDRGILLHIMHGRLTAGCFGVDPVDADSVGLPLASNAAGKNPANFEKWKGVGLFVCFSSRVQEVCKKYWPVEK